ncbi:MAG: peptidoglycan-binding protein [Merismopedia sp. SIO2A8]|nr:peptidoglycan-binding protein [Merismopedia sp. SIO2A8]
MRYSVPRTILQPGSHHRDVIELQRLLSQKVQPTPLTGHFDYDTEIAVKTFQSRMFLNPDGIVGPLTWYALETNAPVDMPTLKQGDQGSAVEAIQELLAIDLYYTGTVDGVFGPATHLAVQRFQADYRFPIDGIIDAKTWQMLCEI